MLSEAKEHFRTLLEALRHRYGEKSHYMAVALHRIGGCLTPHEEYTESEYDLLHCNHLLMNDVGQTVAVIKVSLLYITIHTMVLSAGNTYEKHWL